ncbi:hypothetical protein AHF37_06941 [Paragonimus kellicotti]|nr:hypothetical protein AHF37_06941 [Paragonimus kellicotti]
MDSFESIHPSVTNKKTGTCDFTPNVHEPRVLELLCEICLDNGLYSCALNLALQLHLMAVPTKQSSPNGSSDWIKSCELVLDEDYISFTRSHPAGLSESLWSRLTRLCRSCSPAVPPYIKPDINSTEPSRQQNVELVDNEDTQQGDLDDGEQPPSGIQKRVRFSLSSTHLSPALEAEYGGRSNRRRLLDFARRRQMSAQPTDTPGLCTLFFLWVVYSPLCLLIRCLKQIIYALLYIRVKFILWSCLLGLLLFPFSLITCWSVLRLPWTQVPDQLIHFGQSPLQLTQSVDSLSGSVQQLCSRFLVWFGRCLTSTPSTDS